MGGEVLGFSRVEGAAVVATVVVEPSALCVTSVGLEKENGDGAVKEVVLEANTEAGFSKVDVTEEVRGVNSVDAEVVAAGVSVFWVAPVGLEKENGEGAVKGVEPADGTETGAVENKEVALSTADDTGGKTLGSEIAGGVVAGVCV